MAVKIGECDLL